MKIEEFITMYWSSGGRRIFNHLERAGITTTEQLCEMTPLQISKIKFIGHKTLFEIKECLESEGFKLENPERQAP